MQRNSLKRALAAHKDAVRVCACLKENDPNDLFGFHRDVALKQLAKAEADLIAASKERALRNG